MKRFLTVVCLMVAVLALFACGRGAGDPQVTETPGGTGDGINGQAGSVSGDAALTQQPVISDNEAFNQAEELIKNMTLEEKVGQMFMVSLTQLDPPKKASGRRYRLTKKMQETLQAYHIGGVYLTEKNVRDEEQTRKLVSDIQAAASGGAMYVAAEEEGSEGHSLSAKVKAMKDVAYFPAARQAFEMTEQQVQDEGARIAGQFRSWGINMNLAPVADIGSELNPVYAKRCLGTDTDTAAAMTTAMVEGMRGQNLAVVLKYFPGIGSVQGNCEADILDNTESLMTLRNNNFTVYSDGIKAGAGCVMMANTAVSKITVNDKLPAFLSGEVVTDLLREEIGFQGVIMTPPLNSRAVTKNYTTEYAVVEAVKAGCDMIVMPEDIQKGYDALMGAVISGKIDEKVINTSVRRILQNKIQCRILVLDEDKEQQ